MKSKIFLKITITTFILLGIVCQPAYSQSKKDKQLKIAEDYIIKGYKLFQSSLYSETIEQYDKALNIKINILGEEDTNVADIYNGIGLAYYYEGNYKKSIEINEKALNIRLKILGEGHNDVATSYNNLGLAYYSLGEYPNSIDYFTKALTIAVKAPSGILVATIYDNLGLANYNIGKVQESIEYFEKALKIDLTIYGVEDPYLIDIYSNLGLAYFNFGKYEESIDFYKKAISIQLKILSINDPKVACNYDYIGLAYVYFGDYQNALEYLNKSLEIYLKLQGEESLGVVISYVNLGMAYDGLGDYKKSINYYEKALGILLKGSHVEQSYFISIYNNLGQAYYKLGDYERAIEYYDNGLSLILKTSYEQNPFLPKIYNNLGEVYSVIGKLNQAIDYYEKALSVQIKISGEEHPDIAVIYQNLGEIYYELGNYKKAIDYIEKAIEIQLKTNGENKVISTSYINLGLVFCSLGDYEYADTIFNKALSILVKTVGEDNPEVSLLYSNMAWNYINLEKYNAAIEYLEKGLSIQSKLFKGDNRITSYLNENLGSAYHELGQYEKSIEYFEKSKEINLRLFGNHYSELANIYLAIYLSSLMSKLNQTDLEELIRTYASLVTENTKIQIGYLSEKDLTMYLESLNGFGYERCWRAFLSHRFNFPSPTDALINVSVSTKGILWNQSIKLKAEVYDSGDSLITNSYLNLLFMKQQINKAYEMTIQDRKNLNINLDSIINVVDESEASLYHKLRLEKDSTKIQWQDVQKTLNKNDAIVDISRVQGLYIDSSGIQLFNYDTIQYAALIVTKETPEYPDMVVLPRGEEMEGLWFQNYLSHTSGTNKMQTDYSSYEAYWKPIADKLQGKKNIYFCPDGIYNKINLNVLFDPTRNSYIEDEKNIQLVTNIKEVLKLKQDTGQNFISRNMNAVVIGNPKFNLSASDTLLFTSNTRSSFNDEVSVSELDTLTRGINISQLPGTEQEVNYISSTLKNYGWNVSTYTGPNATEDVIKSLRSPKILHIATHGYFLEDNSATKNIKGLQLLGQSSIEDVVIKHAFLGIGVSEFNSDSAKIKSIENYKGLYISTIFVGSAAEDSGLMIGDIVTKINGTLIYTITSLKEQLAKYQPGDKVTIIYIRNGTEKTTDVVLKQRDEIIKKDNQSTLSFSNLESHDENPLLRSGLLFAGSQNTFNGNESDNRDNGVLTSQEAMSLFLDSTDLVVLSACETAGGDVKNGEGVYGLQRAFRVAGAHSILMSMWKVDDEATKELMTDFYKNWIEGGMNKHDAFKSAQLQLRKIPKYNHPYYWGAFVMVGD